MIHFSPHQIALDEDGTATVELTADVIPHDATRQTIEWSIVQGAEHAKIEKREDKWMLTVNASSEFTVRATIREGLQPR